MFDVGFKGESIVASLVNCYSLKSRFLVAACCLLSRPFVHSLPCPGLPLTSSTRHSFGATDLIEHVDSTLSSLSDQSNISLWMESARAKSLGDVSLGIVGLGRSTTTMYRNIVVS